MGLDDHIIKLAQSLVRSVAELSSPILVFTFIQQHFCSKSELAMAWSVKATYRAECRKLTFQTLPTFDELHNQVNWLLASP
jgi:hypothetical protein